MNQSIRSTLGTTGAADLSLVTDMDSGQSILRVAVGVDVSTATSRLDSIEAKWEVIERLRSEFHARLSEVVGAA